MKVVTHLACVLSCLWLGVGCATTRNPVGATTASMTTQEVSVLSTARAALLNPPRRDFFLKNATVPDAIRAIQEAYGWDVKQLHGTHREILKDVSVSISLHNASKLECIAALCNQAGLFMYQDTDYIGISGSIGHEETGGRNHASADGGLCFLLNFDHDSVPEMSDPLVYCFRLAMVSDVKWCSVWNPVLSCAITKFVYPDGSTPNMVTGRYCTASDIPMYELAKNRGLIKEVKMRVVVGIPDAVKCLTVDLSEAKAGYEATNGAAYMRIDRFFEQSNSWNLAYATGFSEKKGVIENAGIISVLGRDGLSVTGHVRSCGSGHGRDEVRGSYSEETEEIVFSKRPSKLLWTLPTSLEERTLDVRFCNVRVSPVVWERQQRYLDATAGMTLGEMLKRMIEGDDSDKRAAAFHSLLVVRVEQHKRYMADVQREDGDRRLFAVYAVGRTTPHLVNEAERQSASSLMLSLLNDPDPAIVGMTLQGLIDTGQHVRIEDVSRVVALLKAKESSLRRLSASLLGSASVSTERVFEPLILAVGDESPEVRAAAVRALSVILPRLDAKQLAAATNCVVPLAGALQADDEETRRAAATALGALGRTARPAFVELLAAANGSYKDTSKAPLDALLQVCGVGDQSEPCGFSDLPVTRREPRGSSDVPITKEMLADVMAVVVKRLGSPSGGDRWDAVKTLRKFQGIPPDAMDRLRSLASTDEDANTRWEAIEALGSLAQADKDPKTIGTLLAIVDSEDPSDARTALEALAAIGVAIDKVIPALIARLAGIDKDIDPLSVAAILAQYRSDAMPFLIKGLKSDSAKVRQASARAITDIVGGYQVAKGRPEAASGGIPLLEALQAEKDGKTQWYILQAIAAVLPDSKQAVSALLRLLPEMGLEQQKMAVDALAAYEKDASVAVPELLNLLHDSKDEWLRQNALNALKSIGMSRTIAVSIAEMQVSGSNIGVYALDALCPYPDLALRLLEHNSGILSQFGDSESGVLLKVLSKDGPEYKPLQDRLLSDSNLPVSLMVAVGRPAYLGVVQQRIAVAKNDPHHVTYLMAASRALGAKPESVIKISKEDAGSFKPRSAWPGSDERRSAPDSGGHGDGSTPVIITGSLVMKDGSPAVNPAFYNTNDRMLMGERIRESAAVKYDPKTGRFVFQTSIFAAYSMGDGRREPGPYQTGSALVLIEADGAEPLTVRFFDEMPDVKITLGSGPGHTVVQKVIEKAAENASQGGTWGSMPEPQMPDSD